MPDQGDTGPDTPAQMNGHQVVPMMIGGTRYLRKRRVRALTLLLRRGHIERHHEAAGFVIAERYEDTLRSPECAWTRAFVDSSPRPGDVNVAMLEAKRRWADLSRHISREARPVVMAVCCHDIPLSRFTVPARVHAWRVILRQSLEDVAKELGLVR